jgi:Asp-tRNA(Asn)/Glu-tRNA(Gln) amidotransferase A subunit family amidase
VSIIAWVACTYPVNLGRLPATSIPCDGLPVGLHLVSRALREIVP